MKKALALILAVMMALSLVACSGEPAEDVNETNPEAAIIERAEKLAGNKGTREYSSSNHIKQIFVVLPTESGGFINAFESNSAEFEYYSDPANVSSIEGLVIYCTSEDFSGNGFGSVTYMPMFGPKEANEEENVPAGENDTENEEGSEEPKGKFTFKSMSVFAADDTPAPAEVEFEGDSAVIYNGTEYVFPEGKTGLDGAKWMLASHSLELDEWVAEQGEEFAEVIAAGDEIKAAAGEEYFLDANYISYCSENEAYGEYEEYRSRLAHFEAVVAALEAVDTTGKDANDIEKAYNEEIRKLNEINAFDNALRAIYINKAEYVNQLQTIEPTALAELEALSEQIEEIKSVGDNYKDDDRYWKIKLTNPNIGKYEDLLQSIALLDGSIETMYKLDAETDDTLRDLLEKYAEKDQDLYVKYYQSRAAYTAAVIDYETYLETNAAEIAEYNAAADAIKEKYSDDSYKDDVDYMKLELKYEELIRELDEFERSIAATKAASEEILGEREALKEEYEADVAAREKSLKLSRDNNKICEYFKTYETELRPLMNDGGAGETSNIVLEKDGFTVVDVSSAIVESVDSARKIKTFTSSNSSSSSSTKTCAEPGCSRSAVRSGDSVYCSTHSSKCLNCGCYVDKDAMFCMDCLRDALS